MSSSCLCATRRGSVPVDRLFATRLGTACARLIHERTGFGSGVTRFALREAELSGAKPISVSLLRDTALVGALQQCVAATEQFLTTLQDALLPVASRAVQAGAVAYAIIKASPGAEEQVKRSVGKLKDGAFPAGINEPAVA